MRIADNMNFTQAKEGMQRNRSEMSELQTEASSMKRITKPSDDPVGSSRLLVVRTDLQTNDQLLKNMNMARSFLEFSDQSLSELNELLSRAKELAIGQSSSAGANEMTRKMVATEVSQLYKQAIDIGNRRVADRYIFGGFKTTNSPFSLDGKYHGDDGVMNVEINRGVYLGMNLPGETVFIGRTPAATSIESLEKEGRAKDSTRELDRDEVDLKKQRENQPSQRSDQGPQMRGPASVSQPHNSESRAVENFQQGVNIFKVLKDFEVGLRTNDTKQIQGTLENLDAALGQVIDARAEIGSRVTTLTNVNESLQRAKVDGKTLASSIEDADAFEVYSDLNKADTNLKASISTSAKIIQPSLLDFLR